MAYQALLYLTMAHNLLVKYTEILQPIMVSKEYTPAPIIPRVMDKWRDVCRP